MGGMYILVIGLLIIILIQIILIFYFNKNKKSQKRGEYCNIIQRNTNIYCFDSKGTLVNSSPYTAGEQILSTLKIGQNISKIASIPNLVKYFESSVRFKKKLSLKIFEEVNEKNGNRSDLLFSPIIVDGYVEQVIVVSQQIITGLRDQEHVTKRIELEEQRNEALKQVNEIEAQKIELEQAFKKSSKHHIMLQKALRKIESQNAELEKAIDTINQHKIELERANVEIRESSRMKEIFLANTSHEIRTPLNAIIGFTNLLTNTQLDTVQQKYINSIKASGDNLLVVINDILDFSKIEAGKLSLEEVGFDFRNLIKHAVNTLSVKSDEKSINLTYEISPDIPDVIIGDPVRLNQIIINLLGNSIKFTPTGGYVKLKTKLGQPKDNKIKLLFKVEDNGIGIPPDKYDEIFQSFTQAQSNTTRKYGGTGLGLSIVKQLIVLQDGEITVESEVDKGTSFTFYIMLREGKPGDNTHIAHQTPRHNCQRPENLNILLVEDNNINQQLAYDTIKTWSPKINIDVADNGLIAVNKVKDSNYDIILMDIQMPEMDGNQATAEIRKLPPPKNIIPIVAMTAHALKTEKNNCLNAGMNDYISKPFDPEELFAKIIKYGSPGFYEHNAIDSGHQNQENTNNTNTKQVNNNYKYIDLINLRKIYQNNNEKIIKILAMCCDSIPDEIIDIENMFVNNNLQALKAKSHTLKPKFGYLGLTNLQNEAKNIELLANTDNNKPEIQQSINIIKQGWQLALPELLQMVETKNI